MRCVVTQRSSWSIQERTFCLALCHSSAVAEVMILPQRTKSNLGESIDQRAGKVYVNSKQDPKDNPTLSWQPTTMTVPSLPPPTQKGGRVLRLHPTSDQRAPCHILPHRFQNFAPYQKGEQKRDRKSKSVAHVSPNFDESDDVVRGLILMVTSKEPRRAYLSVELFASQFLQSIQYDFYSRRGRTSYFTFSEVPTSELQ